MKICEVCGRTNEETRVGNHASSGMILCEKHKAQYDRHGKFMQQTRFEPNKIIKDGESAYICLNDFRGNIVAKAIIDIEDIDKVLGYKWFMRSDGRVVSNITKDKKSNGSTHIRLHNLVMNFDPSVDDKEIDHIDVNVLNNKKSNLRIVTKSKNGMNRGLQSNNSTGVCGVVSTNHNNKSPWTPQIKKNGKMIRLGNKRLFDEAVKTRLSKEATMFATNSNNHNPITNTIQLTYLSHDDKRQTFIEVDLSGNILKFEKLD